MHKLILNTIISLLAVTGVADAMEKQTRRHPLCGVESYRTLLNDSRCPVDKYVEKENSPACPPIYKSKADVRVCGYDSTRTIRRCERIPGFGQPERVTPPDPELGCGRGYRLVEAHPVKSCRNEAFGIAGYEVCRAPSHGVESYQTCSKPEFGIESYRECSFYKTPEELDAYIEATTESLQTYSQILPTRKGELFTRLSNESAMACLVWKYEGEPTYEEVVSDLKKKFLAVFGYNVEDATVDCNDESERSEIRFTLGTLACDLLPKDALSTLAKPEGVSDNQFTRFKQNCTMKKSYDILVEWFDSKSAEISELLSDTVARSDVEAAQRLRELQADLKDKR